MNGLLSTLLSLYPNASVTKLSLDAQIEFTLKYSETDQQCNPMPKFVGDTVEINVKGKMIWTS